MIMTQFFWLSMHYTIDIFWIAFNIGFAALMRSRPRWVSALLLWENHSAHKGQRIMETAVFLCMFVSNVLNDIIVFVFAFVFVFALSSVSCCNGGDYDDAYWGRMNITLNHPLGRRSARLNDSIGDSLKLIADIHQSFLFLEYIICISYV